MPRITATIHRNYAKRLRMTFIKFSKKFGDNHLRFDAIGGNFSC